MPEQVYAMHNEYNVMGQLLVTLIVPPIVGLITYIVIRRIWQREEETLPPSEAASRCEPSMVEAREEMPAQ